jgi:hypothetical protein
MIRPCEGQIAPEWRDSASILVLTDKSTVTRYASAFGTGTDLSSEAHTMKLHSKAASAATLCAIFAMPLVAVAQVPIAPHQKKAAPPAPLTKPAIVGTDVRRIGGTPLLPPKPPIATAVVPWHPLPDNHRSIIFVGGKPQGGSQVELNPQPIPPGHVVLVDPPR